MKGRGEGRGRREGKRGWGEGGGANGEGQRGWGDGDMVSCEIIGCLTQYLNGTEHIPK